MPVTVADLAAWKARGERFVMLTAYDALTARVLDEAGVPLLLVGDSVGNNVLGYETTIPVTMRESLVFTAAVARGASNALVVGDLPCGAYQASAAEAVRNAARLVKAGAGPGVDGQVLVITDLIGLTGDPAPRFVKRYADLRSVLADAASRFAKDV